MSEEKYPECAKMSAVRERSQTIGEFLEWLQDEKEFSVCQLTNDEYFPVFMRTEELLAEFFEIDLKKLEEERQAMIKELQEANKKMDENKELSIEPTK